MKNKSNPVLREKLLKRYVPELIARGYRGFETLLPSKPNKIEHIQTSFKN